MAKKVAADAVEKTITANDLRRAKEDAETAARLELEKKAIDERKASVEAIRSALTAKPKTIADCVELIQKLIDLIDPKVSEKE